MFLQVSCCLRGAPGRSIYGSVVRVDCEVSVGVGRNVVYVYVEEYGSEYGALRDSGWDVSDG